MLPIKLIVVTLVLAPAATASPWTPANGLQQRPLPRHLDGHDAGGGAAHSTTYVVTDYGAKGDNATDDTKAFAAALDAASSGGGGTVLVPPGLFVLAGELTVPGGVTLRGTYNVVPSHDVRRGVPLDDGSVLIPTGRRGTIGCAAGTDDLDCESSFVTIAANGLVQGLVVYYRDQEHKASPVPYPWTFFLGGAMGRDGKRSGTAENAAIMDVEVLGCYNCIAAVEAHRHYIARIQGQPLNVGVFVDATTDIGRIEDVHFNPWFSSSAPLVYHQTTHGRAFVFGRSDWEYVFNTFAFAYAIGYHFIERAAGSMNGNFVGIGMDLATNASVQVEQSQPFGILITNGEFTAFCDAPQHTFCRPHDPSISPVHVRTKKGNVGAVKFVASSFWGPAAAIAETDGTGTVSFSQCHFDSWDNHLNASATGHEHRGTAAISQLGGKLIVSGSEFRRSGRHVAVAAGAAKTIVTTNMVEGKLVVDVAGKKTRVVVANNADDDE